MSVQRDNPWFAVKRFGYGVGLPIAWQGWLVLTVYMAAMIVAGLFLSKLTFVIAAIPMTAGFVYVCYVKSDDEWRYRNGK